MFRPFSNLHRLRLIAWLGVIVAVSLLVSADFGGRSESVPRDIRVSVLELTASPGFDVPFASNLYQAVDSSPASGNPTATGRCLANVARCGTAGGSSRLGTVSYSLSEAYAHDGPLSLLAKHVRLQI